MTFEQPLFLYFGVAIAAVAIVALVSQARRRRKLAEFLGGPRAAERLSGTNLYGWRWHRMLLLVIAALAIGAATAQPRWIVDAEAEPEEPPVPSVVFAVDISASMQARDASPTRLGSGIERVRQIIAELPENEIGLTLFAGVSYPLAPPTHDRRAIAFLVDGVTPTIASAWDPGSLPSVAIASAIDLLASADSAGERSIVLLGDGEAGESSAATIAVIERAAAAGIVVHTIGVGSTRGAGMSLPDGAYQVGGPVLTRDGSRAISRIRESALREWAAAGGGQYANVGDEGAVDAIIQALIPDPEPIIEEGPEPVLQRIDLAALLAVLALLLILLESLFDIRIPGRWLASRRTPSRTPLELAS